MPSNFKRLYLILPVLIILIILVFVGSKPHTPDQVEVIKPAEESFMAPGKDWPSEKKVEDYFVEELGMSYEEAENARKQSNNSIVMLRVRETITLESLLSNLEYYGFVRDQETLLYALQNTEDIQEGKANPILIDNKTISTWSYYRISEDMTAWEIADELLNNPTYFGLDEYNKTFMPLP